MVPYTCDKFLLHEVHLLYWLGDVDNQTYGDGFVGILAALIWFESWRSIL